MDIRDGANEYQQGGIPPRALSSSYSESPGTCSVPQEENSRNGFYAPAGVPPSNTFLPLSHSISSSENNFTFPGVYSLMSREHHQPDPLGLAEFLPPTVSYLPHINIDSLRSTRRPLLHDPPTSSQHHPTTHRPDHHTSSVMDEFASHTRPVPPLPSSASAHPLPPQSPHLATGPLNTHRDHFHHVMPLSFQNQPLQPQFYYGYHPVEPNHPSRYVPIPPWQPPPYVWHRPSVEASPTPHQQAQTQPIPIPQFAISGPAFHAGPYDSSQSYVPRNYSLPPGHTGPPHHFQPILSRWYHGSGASTETFPEGVSPKVHYRHSIDHGPSGIRRPRRDYRNSGPHQSERSSSSSLDPAVTALESPTTTSATATHSLEDMPVQDSPKIESQELPENNFEGTSYAYSDRPVVRRSYHPDPPPKRSDWVMWVGNVPSDATHDELWRFLTHATPMTAVTEGSGRIDDTGVISIFLIPRSNCAFVNYRSGEQLNHAMAEFSGRKLRPQDRRCPRLVCRERRKEDDLRAGVGIQRGRGVHTGHVKHMLRKGKELGIEPAFPKGRKTSSSMAPTPLSASKDEESLKSDTSPKVTTTSSSSYASTSSSFLARHFPRRFFILKSLTQYDLDLSVERGVWATQKHNETILDQAFRTSNDVMLIFSVNKSGEFYGYARMASGIFQSEYNISWAPRADPSPSSISSLSSSSFPAQSSPEQSRCSWNRSPQMYTVPEGKLPEVSSSLLASSDPDPPQRRADSEDNPGEEILGRLSEVSSSPLVFSSGPDPPLTLHSGSGNKPAGKKEGPGNVTESRSTLRPGSRKTVSRSEVAHVDNSGSRGSRLQLSMEERQNDTGDGTKLASPGIPGAQRGQEGSWGETFNVEWLTTQRVPFNRTRHLRNSWNHGREIKVSRDGTELEPGVGQRLIDEWSNLANTGKRDAKPAAMHTSGSGESKSVGEEHS